MSNLRTSAQTEKLALALAAAQGEFPAITRSKTVVVQTKNGASYSFDYAPLDSILDAVRAPLAKREITVVQPACFGEGAVGITTRIQHGDQWMESDLVFPLGEVAVKDLGGLITYLRRYALCPMLGIVSEMDDDGNASSGDHRTVADRPVAVPKPACPKCGSTTAVIKGKEEYGGGWVCWKKAAKGQPGCGNQWQDGPAPRLPDAESSDPFGDTGPSQARPSQTGQISELIPPDRLAKLQDLVKEHDLSIWLKSTLEKEYACADVAKLRAVHCTDLGMKVNQALKSQEAAVKQIRAGIEHGDSKQALLDMLVGQTVLGPRWCDVLEKEIARA